MISWFRKGSGLVLLAASMLLVGSTQAEPKLYGFRIVQQDHVMLHFDLDSSAAPAQLFSLADPHRLVVDLPETTLATELPSETFIQGVVRGVRYAQHKEGYLRIVLDLRRAVSPTYQIIPRQGGQRLVIDLGVEGVPAYSALPDTQALPQASGSDSSQALVGKGLRDTVVAIDAGHGGKDPGAIGPRKTREKDITLAVAKKLYQRLAAQPGIKPVMVRNADVYVGLRERMNIARAHGADLFVSIHADAVKRSAANGSSVYTLSMSGASSEAAAWLARSENRAAALFGEVTLGGKDDILSQTLLNLTQGSTMERSMEAGADILAELKTVGNVHKPSVEHAAFAVLKSPDIPSVLVETAFISNPEEEKKLKSGKYQDKLAQSIERGIVKYLLRRAPEGTYLAAQRRKQG
ncbi:N-acetylmuramoyl-L-alanine amidase [Granulosicoccus sp.]|nr:N-acetylmuramoyl-L-alanine amidase [Granulosicoccus sp.]MDB4223922.1 N-acetylmuramoyl-L-alanine amidase [Granulosicoccus sp.]